MATLHAKRIEVVKKVIAVMVAIYLWAWLLDLLFSFAAVVRALVLLQVSHQVAHASGIFYPNYI